jgi:hypothetical protein
VTGFKLGHMHIRKCPRLNEGLRSEGYKAIHLQRVNRLDQFISMRLAQINKRWFSTGAGYAVTSFRADPILLRDSIRVYQEEDAMIVKWLDGIPSFNTTYEEIVKPQGYYPVLDFLGLERMELRSSFKKQNNKSQREAIKNYDELKSHFKGSDIEKFFVD